MKYHKSNMILQILGIDNYIKVINTISGSTRIKETNLYIWNLINRCHVM